MERPVLHGKKKEQLLPISFTKGKHPILTAGERLDQKSSQYHERFIGNAWGIGHFLAEEGNQATYHTIKNARTPDACREKPVGEREAAQ